MNQSTMELTPRENAAVERAPASIYEVFAAMARDSSIDVTRIAGLMELQIKAEEREAEKAFNAAFERLLPKLPRIRKDGKIDMGSKGMMKFATIDNIDAVIRPLYTADGFTLSFLSEPCPSGIRRVAILRHTAGHSIRSTMDMPADTGAGRNALQALGSSMSYADRYLTRGIFNIISAGEDTDGNGGTINKAQIGELKDLIMQSDANESKFLEIYGAKVLSELWEKNFKAAKAQLEGKLRAKVEREKGMK